MRRVYLFGGQDVRDEAKALEHVKRAYEAGGTNDDAVLETLPQALGANGEADHGLRLLERLHSRVEDAANMRHYADLIAWPSESRMVPVISIPPSAYETRTRSLMCSARPASI